MLEESGLQIRKNTEYDHHNVYDTFRRTSNHQYMFLD